MVEIRTLAAEDAALFRDIRREALRTAPHSFGESLEELEATQLEATVARITGGLPDSFILGAFSGERLCGIAAFARETYRKRRHRGLVWGVFVRAEMRGRGIARRLLTELLDRVRQLDGLLVAELSVATSEPGARALYASLGFQSFGIHRRALRMPDGAFVDEENMYLDLDGGC
jgi:RimJ/RimL family protein N-acetyltransferase